MLESFRSFSCSLSSIEHTHIFERMLHRQISNDETSTKIGLQIGPLMS